MTALKEAFERRVREDAAFAKSPAARLDFFYRRHPAFDERFIELARTVYLKNDERARIKKEINLALGSAYIEEKSYKDA